MWAVGVYDMGLTSEAFWNLTLRQFLMLADRHKEAQMLADRRAGEVVAMLYNINRDSKKDPKGINWLDVFPEHKPPRKAQTEEEMLRAMELWTHVKPIPES